MGVHRPAENGKRLDKRLKRASQSYDEKVSCTQAVLDAFLKEEIHLPAQQPSDLCGVLRAAKALLQPVCPKYNQTIEQSIERFRTEYGGITCEELLQSAHPSSHCCCMKVKDAVLLSQRALEQVGEERP